MILHATHTHLFPGHGGSISGPGRIADIPANRDCLVEFSDGSATAARVTRRGIRWRLDTGAYRTAAGTDIPEKHWLMRLEESEGRVQFRVLDKARQD